jgi:hypothetical protein
MLFISLYSRKIDKVAVQKRFEVRVGGRKQIRLEIEQKPLVVEVHLDIFFKDENRNYLEVGKEESCLTRRFLLK